MSRLKFEVGNRVITDHMIHGGPLFYTVMRAEPALDAPYFLSNNEWRNEEDLSTYVEPDLTWEQVEAHIKHIVQELREKFQANDANHMRLEIKASGRPDGDIKIKYSVDDTDYGSYEVHGYSLRPTLDEFFRRKTWKQRNEPLALSYDGKDKGDEVIF